MASEVEVATLPPTALPGQLEASPQRWQRFHQDGIPDYLARNYWWAYLSRPGAELGHPQFRG